MIEKLSIRHLRTLRILHQTRSMKETAKLVFRSQPAVSLQIRDLERILGFRLIFHKQGDITFTEQGTAFAEMAAEFERTMAEQIADLRGSVATSHQIGVTHDVYAACLPELSDFADYGVGLVPMTSGEIDAALERGDIAAGAMKSEFPHHEAKHSWVYGLNWAGRRLSSAEAGGPIQLVLLDSGCFYHHVALKLFEQAHPAAVELLICESWDEIAARLRDGGVTVVSSHWSGVLADRAPGGGLPALPDAVLSLICNVPEVPALAWAVRRLSSVISTSLSEGGKVLGQAWRGGDIHVLDGAERQAVLN